MRETAAPALRVREVSKRFGPTRALREASFDVERGTIHALVGGNGSGKSTLIKIMAGIVAADGGQVEVGGRSHDARDITPGQARTAGLRFVHQQSSTFPDLTVAENLAIGRGFQLGRGGRIRWRSQHQRAAEVLERFRISAAPDQPLSALAPARRTMVAIARALQDQDRDQGGEALLILDEPTASLPAAEVTLLLGALRAYAKAGQTILYVSHRLEEVLRVADRVTVLRDGRVADTRPRAGIDHDALVELIMGAAIDELPSRAKQRPADAAVVLRTSRLRGGRISDATFVAHAGEVLGVAGLLGSGRTTLLRLLFGVVQPEAGEIQLDGRPVRFGSPAAAIRAGMAYVPEDRLLEAAFMSLTVADNVAIASLREYWRRGVLRAGPELADARSALGTYLIRAQSERAAFASLSGGNQQKVVLARWLRKRPRVLLLDEPTQGVDVGARAEIYRLVRAAAARGATVLVVSSDTEELALLCDRVLVLRAGSITGTLEGDQLTDARLTRALLDEKLPA